MFTLFNFSMRHIMVFLVVLIVLNICSLPVLADNTVTVKPGQSIMKIMRQVYPDQRSRWPALMRELVQKNPAAFENGDPRSLKGGAVLVLPEQSVSKVIQEKRIRAASVKDISGSVSLFNNMKAVQVIRQGSQIHVGDQLSASGTGTVTLSFIDGAVIKLRCNSVLTIDQYKMRTRGSVSELSISKGSLHIETGRIGKRDGDTLILKTPLASIRAKQAEYGVRVHQARACAEQADVETDGLYVTALSGKVIAENTGGKLSLSSGDAALVAQKDVAPVVTQTYAGMIFGAKLADEAVKQKPLVLTKDDSTTQEDDGVPVWWMVAAAVILGITF